MPAGFILIKCNSEIRLQVTVTSRFVGVFITNLCNNSARFAFVPVRNIVTRGNVIITIHFESLCRELVVTHFSTKLLIQHVRVVCSVYASIASLLCII